MYRVFHCQLTFLAFYWRPHNSVREQAANVPWTYVLSSYHDSAVHLSTATCVQYSRVILVPADKTLIPFPPIEILPLGIGRDCIEE